MKNMYDPSRKVGKLVGSIHNDLEDAIDAAYLLGQEWMHNECLRAVTDEAACAIPTAGHWPPETWPWCTIAPFSAPRSGGRCWRPAWVSVCWSRTTTEPIASPTGSAGIGHRRTTRRRPGPGRPCNEIGRGVTTCHEVSRPVTRCHERSRESRHRAEQSRAETEQSRAAAEHARTCARGARGGGWV
jgi:hypothetical protein